MNPRLPDSKKWTSVPKEYLDNIHKVFSEAFKERIGQGVFQVEGRIYSRELLLRIGYLVKGQLAQTNFEISIEYDHNKENVVNLIYLAIDCAAALLDDYFGGRDPKEYPREWQSQMIEKKELYVQFSTVNTQLETEAARLLGEEAESLINDDEGEEEQEAVLGMLGLKIPTKPGGSSTKH